LTHKGHRSRKLSLPSAVESRVQTERLAELVRDVMLNSRRVQRRHAFQNMGDAVSRGADSSLLRPLLQSHDPEVIRSALSLMVESKRRDFGALALVSAHLDDDDPWIRHRCREFILLGAAAGYPAPRNET
jgi:hypothetical protein